MPDELEPVLLNVRKAYRLLNAYHRRILDTTKTLGESFEKEFDFWYGVPRYTGQDWNPVVFDRESYLGLMPLHQAAFVFVPSQTKPRPREWLLEVRHIGDSAYDVDAIESYDPSLLEPPERSKTSIKLSAAIVIAGSGNEWWKLWDACSYPDDSPDQSIGIMGERVWRGNADGCDVRVVSHSWSVSEFATQDLLNKRCVEFKKIVSDIMVAKA